MDKLIEFEYEKTIYRVLKDQDNRYIFKCVVDGKEAKKLNNKQTQVFKSVINKLVPSDDLIKLSNYKRNGVEYEIFYDKVTGLRYFNPTPNEKDLIYLNNLFNDNYLPYYVEYKKDLTNKYYTATVLLKKAAISVLLSASLSFSYIMGIAAAVNNLPDTEEVKSTEEIVETYKVDYSGSGVSLGEFSDEEIVLLINQALDGNKNLSPKEKAIFLREIHLILDNKEYIDEGYLRAILENIYIEYTKEENEKSSISGEYFRVPINKIVYYNASSYDEVSSVILAHESIHALQRGNEERSRFFTEEVTSAYNYEYFNNVEDSVYNFYDSHFYAAVELLGVDTIKAYALNPSREIIINELCNIIDDRDKAIKFVCNLDDYLNTNPYFRGYDSKEEEKEAYEYHNNLEASIYGEYSEYYEAKYERKMEDDLMMMYYLNFRGLYDEIIDSMTTDKEYEYFWYSIDREKTYFNSKLDNEDNKIVINILGYTNPHEIVFDDNPDVSELCYDEEVVEQIIIDDNTRYLGISNGRSNKK